MKMKRIRQLSTENGWATNSILATPIKDTKDETIIDAFQTHIEYIKNRGLKPYFNIIDNMVSKAIKLYLREENIQIKLV